MLQSDQHYKVSARPGRPLPRDALASTLGSYACDVGLTPISEKEDRHDDETMAHAERSSGSYGKPIDCL